jgi:hypothetical protein
MTLRRTDGQEIEAPASTLGDTPELIAELRKPSANPGNRAREALAERRDVAEEESNKLSRDEAEAARAFDVYAKDLHSAPLMDEVLRERARELEAAAKDRRVLDWNTTYRGIADRVRAKAGLPTFAERERYEAFKDLKSSRGK